MTRLDNNVNRTLEKFYTKTETAKLCVELWRKTIKIDKNDTIIEPSAGNGSFSNLIKDKFPKFKSYDIQPECPLIIKQDFLQLDLDKFSRPIHFIGNPPFGKNSSIAKKFIKKCSLVADSISFILPKSFKKESYNKTFSLYFHNVLTYDLPIYSFTVVGVDYNVPCCFQIWVKKKSKEN
jgi:predicted RNA methylase